MRHNVPTNHRPDRRGRASAINRAHPFDNEPSMPRQFLRTMISSAARAAQQHYYGRSNRDYGGSTEVDELGADEAAFLLGRDSFYLATVTADGWPYVQHRGGPVGFLTVPTPRHLAFADYGGNRQLISTGNITAGNAAGGGRVCLFAMDYAARTRLKVLGTAEVLDARVHPDLVASTAPAGGHAAAVERVVRITVQAFDWNCPKFITPRYTEAEVAAITASLAERIEVLELELRRARE